MPASAESTRWSVAAVVSSILSHLPSSKGTAYVEDVQETIDSVLQRSIQQSRLGQTGKKDRRVLPLRPHVGTQLVLGQGEGPG